jgi:hypothetical protein
VHNPALFLLLLMISRVKALSHVQGGKIASSAKKKWDTFANQPTNPSLGLQPCIIEAYAFFRVSCTPDRPIQVSGFNHEL